MNITQFITLFVAAAFVAFAYLYGRYKGETVGYRDGKESAISEQEKLVAKTYPQDWEKIKCNGFLIPVPPGCTFTLDPYKSKKQGDQQHEQD